jgi:peptidoglycan hydrolase-like protein with peptidoglycan-binding domain
MKRSIWFSVLVILTVVSGFTVQANTDSVGEKRMFSLTGYYSPLANQGFFLTGSYESEIRLNGRGVAGADGTPVYPGMIAAPKSYAFGTIVCLPDYGCGKVHDRGGAIVEQGGRSIAKHDRLDIWTGYGLDGLQRALAIGLKHKEGVLYAPGSNVPVAVNFAASPSLYDLIDAPERKIFNQNLEIGDEGARVFALQEILQNRGYLSEPANNYFGLNTKEAVLKFQKDNFVIDNETQAGAGRFGPKTRQKLSDVLWHDAVQKQITDLWNSFEFEDEINHGERSSEVSRLQRFLVEREYLDVQPTGFFGPKTEAALIEFQLEEGIVLSSYQNGSGNFGPKTLTRVNDILSEQKNFVEREDLKAMAYKRTQNKFQSFANNQESGARFVLNK